MLYVVLARADCLLDLLLALLTNGKALGALADFVASVVILAVGLITRISGKGYWS